MLSNYWTLSSEVIQVRGRQGTLAQASVPLQACPEHRWRDSDGETRFVQIVRLRAARCAKVQIGNGPAQVAFEESFHGRLAWEVANLTVDLLFILEVLLAFRTGFHSLDGGVVTDPPLVARHYVRGGFALDAVAA